MQIGDKYAIRHGTILGYSIRIAEVTRVTKSQFSLGDMRFMRKSLRQIEGAHYAEPYNENIHDGLIKELEDAEAIRGHLDFIKDELPNATLEQLDKISDILDGE